jgi:peptidoglycan/LPS O-acetylase OafA/YrhL
MEKKKKHLLFGIIIILISIGVLYFNLSLFEGGFKNLWPALLLLVGLILYIYYFSTKKKRNKTGVIFLATFIALSSVPLFVLTFTSFENISVIWPGFLLSVGLGVITVHVYGQRKKITLFLSQIIIAVSLLIWIIFAMRSKFGLVIGVVLLLSGAAFLTRGLIREPEHDNEIESEIDTEKE